MVQDFPDAFSNELRKLPPKRKLEFAIDLVLETYPISLSPYRMPFVEIKKLRTQLYNLVDKGFVCPNVLP